MRKKRSKDDIWTAFAAESGGEIVKDRRGRMRAIRYPTDAWSVVLDTHTVSTGQSSQTYTRVRALYRRKDDFRFRVYRNSIFTGIGKAMGMEDLEVGLPQVDRDYVIQSNSAGKVQSLLLRREIAEPLAFLRTGKLQARPFRKRGLRGDGWFELVYEVTGVVKDELRLRHMVGLLQAAIRHLGTIGSAAAEAAPVDL